MPTYEFRCPLGHEFERFYRSIGTAEAQTACPECGQIAERRMSAGAGLLFKGSGFYLTDYGKDAHRKKAPAESNGQSGGTESGSASGDGASPAPGGASGAGGESSKNESAKSEPAKSEPAKGGSPTSEPSKRESSRREARPAESKPAPKPSDE